MPDVDEILSQIEAGDPTASEQLLPLVYQELRKLAAAKLARENSGQSLQPTVIVHEAYLKLVSGNRPPEWMGRAHFVAAAAEAMRRILVDRARRKASIKHGGKLKRVDWDAVEVSSDGRSEELIALNEALSRLEEQWPDKAKVVKLRYFAGMTIPEIAKVLQISVATAERHWSFARAWLHSQLTASK